MKFIITDSADFVVIDSFGTSEEEKPTQIENKLLGPGCWYLETDTKKVYFYDGTNWLYMYSY